MSDDPYKYFRIELAELLQKLHEGVLAMELGQAGERLVSELLRYAHTLKGAARVVRQVEIANAAHRLEDRLQPYRGGAEALASDVVSGLLSELSVIRQLGDQLSKPSDTSSSVGSGELLRTTSRTLRTDLGEVDAVLEGTSEALVELGTLRQRVEELSRVRTRVSSAWQRVAAVEHGSLRVTSPKRTTATEVSRIRDALASCERNIAESVARVERELIQVRTTVERLRLVPASSMFTALDLAVRDAARVEGKSAKLACHGGTIRVEGHVLDLVQQAFLHVVRNAVAHGIEAKALRRARGKAETASISFEVKEMPRGLRFECRDDGAGFDLDAIRQKAAEKHGAKARDMSERELFEVALLGGLSTAGSLSVVAGRGVGMNVLSQVAEQLAGEVGFENRPGQGLRVWLSAPAALAAVDALAVEYAETKALVPLRGVARAMGLDVDKVLSSGGKDVLNIDGELIPYATLSRATGVGGATKRKPRSVVVVRGREQAVAIGVERLVDSRSAVVRRLPAVALATNVVAGVALDIRGEPLLVLDTEGVVERVVSLAGAPDAPERAKRRPVLIVDDSLTTRMLEQSILESAGYDVQLATSGEEGLQMARAGDFGMMLVDVEMPGISGFEFVRQAREDPRLAAVPVVLVSSRSAPEDFNVGRAAGAQGYVVKGRFDQRELLSLMERLMTE